MVSKQLNSQLHSCPDLSVGQFPNTKAPPQVLPVPVIGTLGQPKEVQNASNPGEQRNKGSCVGRLLGKNSKACKTIIDKGDIGQPIPLVRGSRPLAPYPAEGLRPPVPPKDVPANKLDPLTMDKRNLGTAHETFHSNPPLGHLSTESSRDTRSRKSRNRKFVVLERDADDQVIMREPALLTEPVAGRRQDIVFPKGAPESHIHELLSPEAMETNHISQSVKSVDRQSVPALVLSPPEEGNIRQVDPDRLSINYAYKVLHRKAEREVHKYARLMPLAQLVSEAENININDTAALAEALRKVVDERRELMDLLPLASMLCRESGVKFDKGAFKALPEALKKVLSDRDRAQYVASHHKRAREILEARVSELEHMLRSRRGEEDVAVESDYESE
jgi:hypothetical protein